MKLFHMYYTSSHKHILFRNLNLNGKKLSIDTYSEYSPLRPYLSVYNYHLSIKLNTPIFYL